MDARDNVFRTEDFIEYVCESPETETGFGLCCKYCLNVGQYMGDAYCRKCHKMISRQAFNEWLTRFDSQKP